MSEQVLRYRVELDTGGLQNQLGAISSSVTQGLNAGYSAAGQAVGTVGVAGDLLRRDLGMFFQPPPPGTGMYPGGSNQLMSQMSQAGTFPAQQSPFGLPSEFSVAAGFRPATRAVGGVLRRFGFQTELGAKPQNMTEQRFQKLAKESLQERLSGLKKDVGYGAINEGLSAVAFNSLFTGPVGFVAGGAFLAAEAAGLDVGGTIRKIANPGEQLGIDISQVGRAYRAGGSREFNLAQRRTFGKEVAQFSRGLDFFQGNQTQETVASAFESGFIKVRKTGRGPKQLAKEVKTYLNEVKEATESMGTSIEETTASMAKSRQNLGVTVSEFKRARQNAVSSAKSSGRLPSEVFAEQQQFAIQLKQLGYTGYAANNLSSRLLTQAQNDIKNGDISRRTADLLGGAAGVSLTEQQQKQNFLKAPYGNAFLEATAGMTKTELSDLSERIVSGKTTIGEVIRKAKPLTRREKAKLMAHRQERIGYLNAYDFDILRRAELAPTVLRLKPGEKVTGEEIREVAVLQGQSEVAAALEQERYDKLLAQRRVRNNLKDLVPALSGGRAAILAAKRRAMVGKPGYKGPSLEGLENETSYVQEFVYDVEQYQTEKQKRTALRGTPHYSEFGMDPHEGRFTKEELNISIFKDLESALKSKTFRPDLSVKERNDEISRITRLAHTRGAQSEFTTELIVSLRKSKELKAAREKDKIAKANIEKDTVPKDLQNQLATSIDNLDTTLRTINHLGPNVSGGNGAAPGQTTKSPRAVGGK